MHKSVVKIVCVGENVYVHWCRLQCHLLTDLVLLWHTNRSICPLHFVKKLDQYLK